MPHAERRDNVIAVTTMWTEKEMIKQVPGARWDKDNSVWTVPLSWAACLQLRGMFGQELSVGDELAKWSMDELTKRVAPASQLRASKELSDETPMDERLREVIKSWRI